jgi:hypothetical protein
MKHTAQKIYLSIASWLSGRNIDFALAIKTQDLILILSWEEGMTIHEVVVYGTKTKHIAFNS